VADRDRHREVPTWPGFNTTVGISTNHSIMYVGNAFVGGGPHVARSANGGTSWSDATGDLPQLPVNKIVVDPNDASGNTVFAVNWIGIYRSTDGGTNWSRVGTGLAAGDGQRHVFRPERQVPAHRQLRSACGTVAVPLNWAAQPGFASRPPRGGLDICRPDIVNFSKLCNLADLGPMNQTLFLAIHLALIGSAVAGATPVRAGAEFIAVTRNETSARLPSIGNATVREAASTAIVDSWNT
jgi:hypothetical protein